MPETLTARDRLIQRIGRLAKPEDREAVEARWRQRFAEDGRAGVQVAQKILQAIRREQKHAAVH